MKHKILILCLFNIIFLTGCRSFIEKINSASEVNWIEINKGTYTPQNSNLNSVYKLEQFEIEKFLIQKTEVTVLQYHECVKAGKCPVIPKEDRCTYNWPDSMNHPINCITWYDANSYCNYIGARLPSEIEWEYAARNLGKDVKYPWGNSPEPNCDLAIIDFNGRGCGRRNLWPTCSIKKGNTKQGLCDIAGNAWEWTSSDYESGKEGYKVARGGGISSDNIFSTTFRKKYKKDFYYGGLSFRCAK
jgi:sulfatase modifying factor 1